VNVSDAKTSRNPVATLLTHALGSCIGVMLYDGGARVAGMLHFQLPAAASNPGRAKENPAMFADTGMAEVLDQMLRLGATSQQLRVKIAGGAEMLNDGKLFSIGRRNHAAIRKILWQRGLLMDAEDVGGTRPRTVRMRVADGTVTVRSDGEETVL